MSLLNRISCRAKQGHHKTLAALLAACLLGCAPLSWAAPPTSPLVVFLVRHAEKVDDSRDAALSPAGHERAGVLAATLRDANIEHIHSSDYARTRDTARPLADALGLDVTLYDADDLDGLVTQLKQTGGRHLVVGHSGTTPGVVRRLGGDGGAPIEEAGEYDRLYVVTTAEAAPARTLLLRYGTFYQAR